MRNFALAMLVLAAAPFALADEAHFEGHWLINVAIPAEPLVGLLELYQTEDGWTAFVEGGPAPVTISVQMSSSSSTS